MVWFKRVSSTFFIKGIDYKLQNYRVLQNDYVHVLESGKLLLSKKAICKYVVRNGLSMSLCIYIVCFYIVMKAYI